MVTDNRTHQVTTHTHSGLTLTYTKHTELKDRPRRPLNSGVSPEGKAAADGERSIDPLNTKARTSIQKLK